MRLTIIKPDKSVYVNGECYSGIDLSWIPTFEGKEVHALQWYDDHGEVEFTCSSDNMQITELGVFEKAIPLWENRKREIYEYEQEQLRLLEEARVAAQRQAEEQILRDLATEEELLNGTDGISESDLYYDIEELLKEI